MIFDYSKLNGRIVELFGRGGYKIYAERLGISTTTLSRKLHNKSDFSMQEIYKSIEILCLDIIDIAEYFFKLEVQ